MVFPIVVGNENGTVESRLLELGEAPPVVEKRQAEAIGEGHIGYSDSDDWFDAAFCAFNVYVYCNRHKSRREIAGGLLDTLKLSTTPTRRYWFMMAYKPEDRSKYVKLRNHNGWAVTKFGTKYVVSSIHPDHTPNIDPLRATYLLHQVIAAVGTKNCGQIFDEKMANTELDTNENNFGCVTYEGMDLYSFISIDQFNDTRTFVLQYGIVKNKVTSFYFWG